MPDGLPGLATPTIPVSYIYDVKVKRCLTDCCMLPTPTILAYIYKYTTKNSKGLENLDKDEKILYNYLLY